MQMIVLEASDLQWIKGADDDPNDQCAHGRVCFAIDDVVFVRPEDSRWTVSAAALYLLRTLEHDNTSDHSVCSSNFMFPCCGHACWPDEGDFKVICIGCDTGIDVAVKHLGDLIKICTAKGDCRAVQLSEWNRAVFQFADSVAAIYEARPQRSHPTTRLIGKVGRLFGANGVPEGGAFHNAGYLSWVLSDLPTIRSLTLTGIRDFMLK